MQSEKGERLKASKKMGDSRAQENSSVTLEVDVEMVKSTCLQAV